jgi:hypothetical protein
MAENYLSFENESLRGKYARELNGILERNNLNWRAYGNPAREDIFLLQKGKNTWDLYSAVSRISLQIKDGSISFGISGYFPQRILSTYPKYKENGYLYHDKEGNASPEDAVSKYIPEDKSSGPKGRWWLTKQLDNLESIAGEFKIIEPLIFNGKINLH